MVVGQDKPLFIDNKTRPQASFRESFLRRRITKKPPPEFGAGALIAEWARGAGVETFGALLSRDIDDYRLQGFGQGHKVQACSGDCRRRFTGLTRVCRRMEPVSLRHCSPQLADSGTGENTTKANGRDDVRLQLEIPVCEEFHLLPRYLCLMILIRAAKCRGNRSLQP